MEEDTKAPERQELQSALPAVPTPDKLTAMWLYRHMPVSWWSWIGGALLAVCSAAFTAGRCVGQEPQNEKPQNEKPAEVPLSSLQVERRSSGHTPQFRRHSDWTPFRSPLIGAKWMVIHFSNRPKIDKMLVAAQACRNSEKWDCVEGNAEAAIDAAISLGLMDETARGYITLGAAHLGKNQIDEAINDYEKAFYVALGANLVNAQFEAALNLTSIEQYKRAQGLDKDPVWESTEWGKRASSLTHEVTDPVLKATFAQVEGMRKLIMWDLGSAEVKLQESLALRRRILEEAVFIDKIGLGISRGSAANTDKARHAVGSACINLGILKIYRGDYRTALKLFSEARDVHSQQGAVRGVAVSTIYIGMIYRAQGLYAEAQRALDEAHGLLRAAEYSSVGDEVWPLWHEQQGLLYVEREMYSEAGLQFDIALDMRKRSDYQKDHPFFMNLEVGVGHVFMGMGECGIALEKYRRAFGILSAYHRKGHPDVALAQAAVASAQACQGNRAEALELFNSASDVLKDAPVVPEVRAKSVELPRARLLLEMGSSDEARSVLFLTRDDLMRSGGDTKLTTQLLDEIARLEGNWD